MTLWSNNSDPEALVLVNEIRSRAGLNPLASFAEDDLYHEMKKN